ncbi:anti-sigma regulatory factor [bacterium]|nr:anti-sigma regulatory factor [bacterium]
MIQIIIDREEAVKDAIFEAQALAGERGFRKTECVLISTAVSELARNMLLHGNGGELYLSEIDNNGVQGIEVIAEDKGPGIEDIEKAFEDGFSTRGTLGIGLSAVRRIMDEMEVDTEPGKGTRITVRKWN